MGWYQGCDSCTGRHRAVDCQSFVDGWLRDGVAAQSEGSRRTHRFDRTNGNGRRTKKTAGMWLKPMVAPCGEWRPPLGLGPFDSRPGASSLFRGSSTTKSFKNEVRGGDVYHSTYGTQPH